MARNRKMDKQGGTNPVNRDVNAANRAIMAIQLRAKKMTYEEIAGRCGYANASSCRKAILREMQRVVVDNVDELRREEAEGLDRLESKCWERLEAGGDYDKAMLFAVDRIVQIKERRAKLMGLDQTQASAMASARVVIREIPKDYLGDVVVSTEQEQAK